MSAATDATPPRPRVLIVGFVASVHIPRYLDVLRGSGWDLHVFDVLPQTDPHRDLDQPVTLHVADDDGIEMHPSVTIVSDPQRRPGFEGRAAHLADVVRELRPELVHTHELAITGRIATEAYDRLGGFGVPWMATNWGSDLFWNGRIPRVVPHLRAALRRIDYYGAECHRDIALARAFGFRGETLGVWPVTGGVDVELAETLRAPGPTSQRRAIALKGVQFHYGAAAVGLTAIERCGDLLEGWELCGYQMDPEIVPEARALAARIGARYRQLSGAELRESPYESILAMHGRCRVSLGLNRTDGLSTSFVEAMAMGSLPLQGHGSCGYEVTPNGRGALFVDPRDVDGVTAALRRALTDDELVDGAARLNARISADHLGRRRVAARVLDGYERVMSEGRVRAA